MAKICFLTASESIFDVAYKFSPVYTFIRKPIQNNDLIRIVNGILNNKIMKIGMISIMGRNFLFQNRHFRTINYLNYGTSLFDGEFST
jgi:hypothetical protein